ncbi:MAG: tetratricopeptide repeat protein, partial [Acidobacteriota bacterium]
GLFVAGEELAKQRDYASALTKFLACLEKEPGHVRALTRVAEIYFRRAEYLKALDHAREALAIDAYDAAANFIYGVINRRLGNYADAKDGFGWAARSLESRSAAYEQLAELNFLEKKFERAAEYAARSLDYNAYNLEARQIQAVMFRLADDKNAAEKALDKIAEIDPLSHFVRCERYLLNPSPAAQEAFVSLIRNELPHETYLELGINYVGLGREEDAQKVLELAPSHPAVNYWLAYLNREQNSEQSRQYLARAVEASPQLVFPHRAETIPVLRWAAARLENWKTTYYLGLILWNIGKVDEAKDIFSRLADRPDWGPFYLARIKLLGGEVAGEKVLADIQKAIRLDKADWRAWRAQTAFYERSGEFDLALQSARTIYRRYPDKPALEMDYSKALLYSGKYGDCLKILEKTTVLPYEGAWEGRDLYRQANLLSAAEALSKGKARRAVFHAEKAALWPESLGVGKPYDVDERLEDYLKAAAYEKMGEGAKAKDHYEAVAAATGKFKTSWDSVNLMGVFSLRKLGKEEEAVRLLDEWGWRRGQDDPVFAWASAKYHGDEAKAKAVLAKVRQTPAGPSWDMGTGDRHFPLILVILREAPRPK